MKVKVAKKAKSPYVKYEKAPYPYAHKSCSHKDEVIQATEKWRGLVCARCNVITGAFDNDGNKQRTGA